MKKILLSIICIMAAIFAQAEGHMTFKGIEIDGDLKSVISNLSKQGFKYVDSTNIGAMMNGWFTGREVKLFVLTTPISKTVKTIAISYESMYTWSTLKARYEELSSMLKNKYGEPIEDIDDVSDDYSPLHELTMDRGSIYRKYSSEFGNVVIEIKGDGKIQLYYFDKANMLLNSEEEQSDL